MWRPLPDSTNARGEDTVAFLAEFRGLIKGPMTIPWDQSKIHQRSSVLKAYTLTIGDTAACWHNDSTGSLIPSTTPRRASSGVRGVGIGGSNPVRSRGHSESEITEV
jgi:hypothetical protein